MANCPNISQEKSSSFNGWYCIRLRGYAEHSLYTNYCNSTVNNQYCPYNGGDDRIRNPEPLTEEICDSIQQSVRHNLEKSSERMHSFLRELYSMVAQRNYVDLCWRIDRATRHPIKSPSISEEYVKLVKNDVERKRARALEFNLNEMLKEFQPSQYAGAFYPQGSQLEVGSRDFQVISALIRNYRSQIGDTIKGNIDAGGIWKYAEPAWNAQYKLKNAVDQYIQEIQGAMNESQTMFERGCSSVLGNMGQMDLTPPKTPQWRQ